MVKEKKKTSRHVDETVEEIGTDNVREMVRYLI